MNNIRETTWKNSQLLLALIIYLSPFVGSFGQVKSAAVHYYTLSELDTANVDSVRAINLSKAKLSELPTILYKFHHLEYLNLSKNKLNRIDSLDVFVQLRYLDLGKNKLNYFPISICSLTQIEWLGLQSNNISEIPPCIQYCQNLQHLDLWGTMISELPEAMSFISTLKTIDLSAIQLNQYQQNKLRTQFPQVQLKMNAPCNCGH